MKEKILAIERILNEKPQNANEILGKLANRYGIIAERKSIYDDIACLTLFEDIRKCKKGWYYGKSRGEKQ